MRRAGKRAQRKRSLVRKPRLTPAIVCGLAAGFVQVSGGESDEVKAASVWIRKITYWADEKWTDGEIGGEAIA